MKIALESGRVARWLAWTSAGAVAAVGIADILGWVFDEPRLVSYLTASIPLQINTAACLLLCSFAIPALLMERRTLASGLGAMVLVISGLCAVEIFLAPNSGVMRMFFDASGQRLRQMPLAPNSAIALLLAGISIVLLATRRARRACSATAASIAAGIAAFGAMSLIGYAVQLSSAYQWGEKTPMSLPAAVAVVACGLAIVATAWNADVEEGVALPSWSPLALLSALATASVLLFDSLQVDASLTRSWTPSQRHSLYISSMTTLVFGFGTSIALALALATARKAYRQSCQLRTANAALDGEIGKRQLANHELQAERKRLHDLLDAMPAYVILLTPDYHVPFANRFFEERFGKAEGCRCYEYLFQRDTPCENCETFKVLEIGGPHHWEWSGPDGRDYDIHDIPFNDSDGSRLIMEVGVDITDRKSAEAKLEYANRALRLVSSCNQAVARAGDETELLHEICKLAIDVGGYQMVWIGYAREDERKSVQLMAAAGVGTEYVVNGMVTWADEPRGQGPTGTSIRSCSPVVCNDTLTDDKFLPWRKRALAFGFESSLVVPLLREGRAFGALSIYSGSKAAFGAEEVKLYCQLAADLSFGIDGLRVRGARKAAEAAVRASEERYRCLTVATAQIVWLTDANGLVSGDMPTWRSFTGMTVEQIQGWGWIDSLHPNDRERTSQIWKAAVGSCSQYETEYRIRRADGEYRHVWVRGVPVLEQDGAIREWVGICTDITERHRAEQRLCEQAALLELAPAAILVRDLDSRVVYWSRGAEDLYGWTAEEAAGRVTHDLLHTEFPVPVSNLTEQVLSSGFWEGELTHICRDGRRITVASRWAVQRNEAAEPVGFLEINVDVTERKRAQEELAHFAEELQRSNAELQDFAFVASHDLQEPLRKITAFSDRLRDRCAAQLDETGQDSLNRMHSAAERMARLIDSLLGYSRLSTRAQPFEDVDLAVTCAGVLADLEQRIRETGARVVVRPLPWVMGDSMQLRQLLQNLLGNALKFHAAGGRPEIRVQSLHRDGRWEISVSDNGIGFDPAYAERIFRPFQRLHGRSEYEGSGMGLAICRKIAQRHGAGIQVESRPGKGSTFTVSLPESAEYQTRLEARGLSAEENIPGAVPQAACLTPRA